VAIVVYAHALNYYFSEDDFTFLARARGLLPYPDVLCPLGGRLLSARLYFQAMNAFFGLEAGPYHWVNVLLHAANAVLVYAIARKLTMRRLAALAAGAVFASLDLAFTAVFWISGVQDLLAAAFMLVTALIWVSSDRKTGAASALSSLTFALSLLSKESGILFPGVLLALAWAQGTPRRRALAAAVPHIALSAAALALALVQRAGVPTGGAYETGLTRQLVHNLSTYIVWTADVAHPYKDRVAVVRSDAWRWAAPAAGVVLAFLITLRGRLARISWAGAAWYALALAPVLPLLRHTYLYYLYPAAPGAAILFGAALERMRSAVAWRPGRAGERAGVVLAVALACALCATGARNVRERESEKLPPDFKLPHDHVLRSAVIAENSAESFDAGSVPDGADLLLINPFPRRTHDLTGESAPEGTRITYDVVRSALRDGLVLKLLAPHAGAVRFTRRMSRDLEDAHTFLYTGMGELKYLGTGADIWANLSSAHVLMTKDFAEAAACARRALEIDPDQPRAHMNLGIALAEVDSAEAAIPHFRRAAELAPTARMRNSALHWLERLGGAVRERRQEGGVPEGQ